MEGPLKIRFEQLACYSLTHSLEDKIMLIDDPGKLRLHEGMELDFIALLFCTQGHIELNINEEHYIAGANDVLYCNHRTLLHRISLTPGYKGKLLCVSWDYAEKLLMRGTCRWESILHTRQYPLLHLQPHELQLLRAYYRLFAVKAENRFTLQGDADNILLGFFQDFHQIMARRAGNGTDFKKTNDLSSRKNELFKKFMVLLKENFRQEHFQSFYATHLYVTPKYLGTVVKEVSGQSVSKWIETYLTDEIKSLLHHSNLTINEISCQLNFSNPSFFGKFVKAKTGDSPGNLRKRLRAT